MLLTRKGQSGQRSTTRFSSSLADTLSRALPTMDRRKCPLRGEVRVENLVASDAPASDTSDDGAKCLVVMKRSKGDPLEWRRLFRELCRREEIRSTIIST